VIARVWRGWTRTADADAYVAYIDATGMASYAATPGNRGAWMLRRALDDGRTEFVTLSLWESMDAVRAFAGDDPSRAVFYPDDERSLVDRETTVTHFDVASGPPARDTARDDASPVRELRVAYTVDDFAGAVAFWNGALGLPVVEAWERDTGRGAILAAGRATLELLSADQTRSIDSIEAPGRADAASLHSSAGRSSRPGTTGTHGSWHRTGCN
jgi:heme-degrading monooxygenase HmoA